MGDQNSDNIREISDLAHPNWGNPNDRRRIAACLVEVVYQLGKGKEKEKFVSEWCNTLQFKVEEKIKETIKDKETIFGAVFKPVGGAEEPPAPSQVVAFRGTIAFLGEDLKHNWKIINAQHGSDSRVNIAIKCLQEIIRRPGPHNIWIAGHSLGAAIAMAAARQMEREKRDKIETHLFNPPFLSPRLPEVKFFEMVGKTLSAVCDGPPSHRLHVLEGVYKKIEGASKWMQVRLGLEDENRLLALYGNFVAVSGWIPNIYLSKNDPVCFSYFRYFKVMQGMYKEKRQPLHERMKYLFCYEVAKNRTPWHLLPSAKLFYKDTKPWHLLPSAKLFSKDTIMSLTFNHDLSQWWSKNLKLKGKEYVPPVEVTQWKPNAIKSNAALPARAE